MAKEVAEREYSSIFGTPEETLSHKTEKVLLEKSEVGLMIEGYDDIFSDFDPRPYTHRSLSIDFLDEAKRAVLGKPPGNVELIFLMGPGKRNPQIESQIKRRLREHFHKHFLGLRKEKTAVFRKGVLMTAIGIALMVIASFLLVNSPNGDFLQKFLIVLIEPAGWFLFWEGLDFLLLENKHRKPELEFYEKMATSRIEFLSYK